MRYVLSETWSGLRRNASMTLSLLVTMWVSLTLFGVGLMGTQQVDLIRQQFYERVEPTIFLCTTATVGGTCVAGEATTDAQRADIRAALEEHPGVASVRYKSQAEVFEEFREAYSDSAVLSSMSADDMQDLFSIRLVNPEEYQTVLSAVRGMPGVQAVQDLREYLEPMFDWLNLGRWLAVGASALLFLAAGLQIVNTIRMAAFARRRELAIMRLVGASVTYIMLPFLLESLVAALAAAALACATLAALQEFVIVQKAQPAIQTVEWIGWDSVAVSMVGVVAVAVVLSMIPTLIAARRHLRV